MFDNITQVAPNLWIGSYPMRPPSEGFDKMIVCCGDLEGFKDRFPNTTIIESPIDPHNPTAENAQLAVQTGRAVAGWLRRGLKVLVCCSSGYNRSAFVAAITLMVMGRDSHEAIETIQKAVERALHNQNFVGVLKNLEGARAFIPAMGAG